MLRSRWAQWMAGAAVALSVATSAQAQTVKAQYHTWATGSTGNQLQPLVNLVNAGTTTVSLSTVTVRYWFTKDGTQALNSWCDYTPRGCSNVTRSFVAVSPAVATADTYLQLAFASGAGTLAPGQSTGDLQLRVAKTDWTSFNQANDWSFDATKSSAAADWTHVTVYVNGALVWGAEPVSSAVDTIPPTISLAATPSSTITAVTTLSLVGTATDNTGVTKVEFYDGTALLGSDTTNPYVLPLSITSANNGIHSYTAKAFDAAGNMGVSSAVPVTVAISCCDTGVPTVSLASSVTVITNPIPFTLTATAADDVGVTKVEFYLGTTLLATDTTAPYTLTLQAPTSNGTYSYTARAYDAAGNNRTSTPVLVTVSGEVTPPTCALTASATNVINAGTLTLTANATDNVGVVKVEFYDGTSLLGSDTSSPYTQAVSLTGANNGTHSYTCKAYDASGGIGTSAVVVVTVNVDVTPPTTPVLTSAQALTSTSARVCWTTASNEYFAYYEIYLGTTQVAETSGDSVGSICYTLTGLAPATAYSVAVRARDTAGNRSPLSTALSFITSPGTTTADVTLTVDTSASRRAISPYVYGYNAGRLADAPPGATYLRIGGNRWTAYNWTNNYSNAGSDWGPYSNDTFFGTPTQGPGYGIAPTINDAKANGLAALVTIPIQGWVSQAKSGNVPLTDPVTSWFVPNLPAKGSAFTLSPSPSSATVYQDELANFVASAWGTGATPHLSLDNEPDLWGYVTNGAGTATHPEVQRAQLTYAAFLQKSIASATAIKAAVPSALVFGPVSYGWNGMLSFQSAPDSTGATIDNSFIDYYLAQMAAASTSTRRLLDVLDLHWYSEATCSTTGARVTSADNSDCVVAARVQAPRSLFDPTFVETSWITQWTTASSSMGAGIQLLPRFQAKIAAKLPGTKLALTEYNHGGEDHVSGAIAQADTLGILGREGVYAGAFWSINGTHDWSYAAWKAYRNYDGAGHSFGDTSVSASTTDVSHVSVYASVDSANPNRLVLVVVHRPTLGTSGALDLKSRTVQVNWAHGTALRSARAWRLASGSTPSWQTVSVPAPTSNTITLTLPALSVTTVELTP